MRGAPVRSLPVAAPVVKKPVADATPKAATTESPALAAGVNNAPDPKYAFRIDFAHLQTREQRTEIVELNPEEIAEAFLDGIGPTGARGREIALRVATARVPPEFAFAGKPDSVRFDMARLVESLNRD